MSRLDREQKFHDELAKKSRLGAFRGAYSIFDASKEHFFSLVREGGAPGERVLELGCGRCVNSLRLAAEGAQVEGIDLSPGNVELSRQLLVKAGLADRVKLSVMNAEELDFPEGSFEVVCGMGILHHLNLERAAAEIQRVLKPGGRAVFLEPLGHNPVINLFRRLTPKARTQDEHPLLMKDLALLESLLGTPDFHFHHLAELLAIPFAKTPLGAPLRRLTGKLDGRLLGRPSLQPLAWVVVMRFTKPPAA